MSVPKNVLWKASDGREFSINTKELGIKTMEELYEHIADLRKKHGYDDPTFLTVAPGDGRTMDEFDINAIDVNDLPDDLKEEVIKAMSRSISLVDPKKT